MNESQTTGSQTTRRFARVIGPFLAIITATAAARAPDLWAQIPELPANPLWTWVTGTFTLLAGLIVIAAHPYWRGVAAFSITGLGWLTVIKGALLVAFPSTIMSLPGGTVDDVGWLRVLYVGFAVLGLYLTYVGWGRPSQTAATDRELSHRP